MASLGTGDLNTGFEITNPTAANRFNFRPLGPATEYDAWPDLIALAEAEPFSGLAEMRRGALVDVDRERLATRMQRYFDPTISFETLRAEQVGPVAEAGRFAPETARERLLSTEQFSPERIVRYSILPLDTRFAYYTTTRPIWNEPRPEFGSVVREGSRFLVSRMMAERPQEGLPVLPVTTLPDYHLLRPNVRAFPFRLLQPQGDLLAASGSRANLSTRSRQWLGTLSQADPDVDSDLGDAPWFHALAICSSPRWLAENQASVLGGWPRVPLPSEIISLSSSASLGRQVATLLDTEQSVAGVTSGSLQAPYASLGRLTRLGGGTLAAAELRVDAGWGRGGHGAPVMPGGGRTTVRTEYDGEELQALVEASGGGAENLEALISLLGQPIDVYLNDVAFLKGVPTSVWRFTIGGYQVLKKWLSYRDVQVTGRSLSVAEAREATAIVRRLSALVLLHPALDANYQAIQQAPFHWAGATSDGPA